MERPLRDEEWPDPEDADVSDDGSGDEDPCPHCGQPVYEAAPKCPKCGEWIEWSSAARRSRGWFWPVVVAILIVMMLVAWHGLGR